MEFTGVSGRRPTAAVRAAGGEIIGIRRLVGRPVRGLRHRSGVALLKRGHATVPIGPVGVTAEERQGNPARNGPEAMNA